MSSKPDPKAVLADAVRATREAQKKKAGKAGAYTQEALAHDAGMTTSSVVRIELGSVDPRWSTVWKVKQALGISMEALGKAIDEAEARRRAGKG